MRMTVGMLRQIIREEVLRNMSSKSKNQMNELFGFGGGKKKEEEKQRKAIEDLKNNSQRLLNSSGFGKIDPSTLKDSIYRPVVTIRELIDHIDEMSRYSKPEYVLNDRALEWRKKEISSSWNEYNKLLRDPSAIEDLGVGDFDFTSNLLKKLLKMSESFADLLDQYKNDRGPVSGEK